MAGSFTDIVAITAPNNAIAGEVVSVSVNVRSLYSSSVRISVAATYNGSRFLGPADQWISPGATGSWSASFTMPNFDVDIWAYSSYMGTDGLWHLDDELSKSVSLEKAWLLLATKLVTLTPLPVGWQKLATKTVTMKPIAWKLLATKTVTLTPTPTSWVLLATKTITLTPSLGGWVKLADLVVTLDPLAVPDKDLFKDLQVIFGKG